MSSLRRLVRRLPVAVAVHGALKRALPARRWNPEDFGTYVQHRPAVLMESREKDACVREAMAAYANVPVTDEPSGLATDPIRILQFFQMVSAANALAPGDYAEFGSHRGFGLRAIHRFMDPSRHLFSFDTFEGFDSRDIAVEGTLYDSPWKEGNFAPTSVERVARYVGDGTPPANLTLVKGWFPDSYAGHEVRSWRFVHIDFDLYQPIKAALERVWPQMVPGGVILVHDYGSEGFPAARRAVDEFGAAVGVAATPLVDR
jgi:hypothetical protein